MERKPSVAVCVPAYRPQKAHIQDLVASVARQSRPVDELIIRVDPAEEEAPAADFSGVDFFEIPHTVIQGSRRLGMAANWNATVAASQADYFILPGQDDMLAPHAVSIHLRNIRRTGTAISCSDRQYVDATGAPRRTAQRSVGSARLFKARGIYEVPFTTLLNLTVMYGNVMGEPCGTMISREAFDSVGGYNPELLHGADVDLTLRMAHATGVSTYDTRRLSYCRLHAGNETLTNVREGHSHRDRAWLLGQYAAALEDPVRARAEARLLTHAAYDAWRMGGTAGLRTAIRRSSTVSWPALLRELIEILGWPPRGRRLVRECPLWPL